ncbi:hypothetical protein OG754_37465 [Streptomyces decoyicus]|uniref:hypothetical protein n=1 Tax=Streptomyces decoyicus TaxID=249567 RepID=UPI002E32F99D|nr:hypothetical protein [Streptomyces decoyicus]
MSCWGIFGWRSRAVPQVLDGLAPDKVEITSVDYYRPDGRFSPQTNAARIGLARPGHAWDHAAGRDMGVPLSPRTGVAPVRSQ